MVIQMTASAQATDPSSVTQQLCYTVESLYQHCTPVFWDLGQGDFHCAFGGGKKYLFSLKLDRTFLAARSQGMH